MDTITLGRFIEKLEGMPDQDAGVWFDFGYMVPCNLDSYRGYYDHLALGYQHVDNYKSVTVAELLRLLKGARGREFTGWKGGNYVMGDNTPVWVDLPGDASSTIITGVVTLAYSGVRIETKQLDR